MFVDGSQGMGEPVILGTNALGRCKRWREEMVRAMESWNREDPVVKSLRREVIPPKSSKFIPAYTENGKLRWGLFVPNRTELQEAVVS